MLTMSPIGAISSVSTSMEVRVSEKCEDQHEKVVGKLLEGIKEAPKPESRSHHRTGQVLNIAA